MSQETPTDAMMLQFLPSTARSLMPVTLTNRSTERSSTVNMAKRKLNDVKDKDVVGAAGRNVKQRKGHQL